MGSPLITMQFDEPTLQAATRLRCGFLDVRSRGQKQSAGRHRAELLVFATPRKVLPVGRLAALLPGLAEQRVLRGPQRRVVSRFLRSPADILGRSAARTLNEPRIINRRVGGSDGLDGDGTLPIINKVVGVRELVDAALDQSAELLVGMIYQRWLQPREVCQNPFDHLAIFRA